MAQALDELLDAVAPYSKCPRKRLMAMAKACAYVEAEEIEGDIVECGVWRGGNIILARLLCPDRVCWLYDTFRGMANPSEWDRTRGGYNVEEGKSAVSAKQVISNLNETGTLDFSKLHFIAGKVEETLLNPHNVPESIALLRLDTDWYWSTKIELEALWPRLEPGGVLIVDDYGHWKGARKAVDDFFGNSIAFEKIDYTAVRTIKHAEM